MEKNEIKANDLLSKLESKKDEEVSSVTFRGLAVSRSKTNLHLAVATGVVAIPIESIQEVLGLSPINPMSVSIKVRHGEDVKHLKRFSNEKSVLSPIFRNGGEGSDIEWPPIYGPGVNTSVCITTVTDGNACDDFECQDFSDD